MTRNPRGQDTSDGHSPDFSEQYLLDRLVAAGVGCLDDWLALSPRAKRNVFGITSGMAQAIDRMAQGRKSTQRC